MSTPNPTLRLTGAGQVLTCQGPDRGKLTSWSGLGELRGGDVVLERTPDRGWVTTWLGATGSPDRPAADTVVDLQGRLLLPGLVDAHTHAVFAGDRSAEFNARLAGKTYAQIAAEGGGIALTVRSTRAASLTELVSGAAPRLAEMAAWGVRVVELKTGYGLDEDSELRILQAIEALRHLFAGRLHLVATAMPAHAIPPEHRAEPDRYVDEVCERILPRLASAGIDVQFVDAFVEKGYFTVAQAQRVWQVARTHGWRLKAHVDEFEDVGGLDWALEQKATSVEHLLVTGPAGIARLAASPTVAVGLPLTSVFLREGFAPLRALVDAGALVALGTDCNPGSAMTTNLPLAMQMAVLGARLTPQEAVRAVTRCGALALAEPGGLTGRLAVGEPALPSVLDLGSADELFYHLGAPPRGSDLLDAWLLGGI